LLNLQNEPIPPLDEIFSTERSENEEFRILHNLFQLLEGFRASDQPEAWEWKVDLESVLAVLTEEDQQAIMAYSIDDQHYVLEAGFDVEEIERLDETYGEQWVEFSPVRILDEEGNAVRVDKKRDVVFTVPVHATDVKTIARTKDAVRDFENLSERRKHEYKDHWRRHHAAIRRAVIKVKRNLINKSGIKAQYVA